MKSKQIIYSGICKCGHSWEDHHLGMIINTESYKEYEARGEPPYLPQECEYYGFNEYSGLMPDPDNEYNWIEHCSGYVDKDSPEEN